MVRYLAEKGAKVEVWNHANKKGWTPLKIVQGIPIGMNIAGDAPTRAAIQELLNGKPQETLSNPYPASNPLIPIPGKSAGTNVGRGGFISFMTITVEIAAFNFASRWRTASIFVVSAEYSASAVLRW